MTIATNKLEAASASSLERLIPAELDPTDVTGAETYRLHLERYEFAARFVSGGRVLDCACGVGYGSDLLSKAGSAEQVVMGVDIDPAAVAYADANYRAERVSFTCADGTQFAAEPFDTIVSFETIEHVPDPEALIDNVARLLKPGGKLIASVPVTPSVDVNPYHLHDFTQASFRRMFEKRGFTEVDSFLQRQPFSPFTIMAGKEVRLEDMRKNLVGYYAAHPYAAWKRACSTLVDGFCNKYLACAFTR